MKSIISILLALFLAALSGSAQTVVAGKARFDRTVHDFGKVLLSDGPVSCEFTVENVSSDPMNIQAVISSCGCTSVKWTRETLKPGELGKVSATFSNDEGPYPFDKTLTVYISDVKKPVVLHLRGVAVKGGKK